MINERRATSMSDNAAYQYYVDPHHREPAGEGRSRGRKSSHIPVRFTPTVIAEVKRFANRDHKTVSAWIREVVEGELDRRRPYETVTHGSAQDGFLFSFGNELDAQSVTGGQLVPADA